MNSKNPNLSLAPDQKMVIQKKVANDLQGQPLGIDIMYLVLADRNMQVRFGLKVVGGF